MSRSSALGSCPPLLSAFFLVHFSPTGAGPLALHVPQGHQRNPEPSAARLCSTSRVGLAGGAHRHPDIPVGIPCLEMVNHSQVVVKAYRSLTWQHPHTWALT